MIQELGGDVLAFRVEPQDAVVGHMIKELGLPREALINLIVRDERGAPAARLDRRSRPATSSTSSSAARPAARSPG